MPSPTHEYRFIESDTKTIISNGEQPVTSFEVNEFWQAAALTNDEQPISPVFHPESPATETAGGQGAGTAAETAMVPDRSG